ncbi:SWIM zinc finger family protein [Glutamicibacter sp. M10]|uniref:SWIM zinc finger family protein n=1 Tax=Glutamicibacter sp. M10 TaxID=3023076 RepID=UPI0021C72BA0|nr:SWIM zinc finger family protein [Glutamicibacter sp. M10]UXN31922.1 SWIM zinc finger family protein [Glutamicibacter sp. M10]
MVDVEFDETTGQIEGTVRAADGEFSPMIQVQQVDDEWKIELCECSCDKPGICAHIAALAIVSNKIASMPRLVPVAEEKARLLGLSKSGLGLKSQSPVQLTDCSVLNMIQ